MNPAVFSALTTLAGVLISAILSWLVARSTANKELLHLEKTWVHEALVSSEEDFSKMAALVATYSASMDYSDHAKAQGAIAEIRAREHGALATALDELYVAAQECRKTKDRNSLDIALSKVIQEKRKANSQDNAANTNI